MFFVAVSAPIFALGPSSSSQTHISSQNREIYEGGGGSSGGADCEMITDLGEGSPTSNQHDTGLDESKCGPLYIQNGKLEYRKKYYDDHT